MKKIYLAAVIAVFLPVLASAAAVNPSSGSGGGSASPVSSLSSSPSSSMSISAPGFVWGFYNATPATTTPGAGAYVITFNCSCGWSPVHYMHVTSFDPTTGAFTAIGTQKGYPGVTWTAVGTTTINPDATGAITMQITYTGDYAPYAVSMTGTIGNDGTLSGTGNSVADGNTYTWTMNEKAQAVAVNGNAESCSGFTSMSQMPLVGTSSLTNQGAADAGINGNVWATDNFDWTLRVRKISPGSYCGVVYFLGTYTTPTGTEAGPNINYPAATINGSTTGDMAGFEVFSFTASGTAPTWTNGDIWNWMNDNFVNPQITSENQLWVYGHSGKTQQWIETYNPIDGWLNYGNITKP